MLVMLAACATATDSAGPTGPPYGMPLVEDGVLYAGVARIETTPGVAETYTDANENNEFDGCITDPTGERTGCNGEGYVDANGDGHFNGTWIAGFGGARAAMGVHDPLSVTSIVLSLDGEYVALVGVDAIGLLENRTRDARDLVGADGFDRDRVVISSSHVHSGPDTVGIWGPSAYDSGVVTEYVEAVVEAIHDTIEVAASDMVPVSPKVGLAFMTDQPELNGLPYGGTNPDDEVEGGIHDIRDPLIPDTHVYVMALEDASGARLATLVNSSGHPEVSGSDHSLLSADYVGVVRRWTDEHVGGTTMFMSGALGGMQSALGGTLPRVDENGDLVKDADGVQQWVEEDGWEKVETYGILVAKAAQAAATDTTAWSSISVARSDFLIPVENVGYTVAFAAGILDTPESYIDQTPDCPGYGSNAEQFGCVPAAAWMVRLGESTLGTVPGELFPELFWGVPDEPAMSDASLRVDDRRWPRMPDACAVVDFADCKAADSYMGCNCLDHHATPYRISDAGYAPIVDMLPGTYRVPVGITNGYCGYIVPEPDFNTTITALSDEQGDHYEESNSCTVQFAPIVQEAFSQLTGT
jgi:hypothetical protein